MRPGAAARSLLALLCGVVVIGLAAASRAPWRSDGTRDGRVRISLSARPDRVESCRALSAEELAARPAHMRQPVVCEGAAARYRLTVEQDGQQLLAEELTGGGARRDRPMHLLREFPLPAGPHHLVVQFALIDSLPVEGGASDSPEARGRETETRDRRRRESVPQRLVLDTTITITAQRIVLVTYDPLQRRLIALSSPRTP